MSDGKQNVDGESRSSNERPAWITDGLIADTLRVWSSRSAKPLSEPEAVSLILQFGNLLDATGLMRQQEMPRETVHGTGSGKQS